MTTTKKVLMYAAAVFTVGSVALLGSTAANAQDTGGMLVERIASRFNVNREDVQKVFDEARHERLEARHAEFSDHLQQKVDDGELTAQQKTQIEQKLKEIEQRRQAERDELERWAANNNIALKYLHFGRGHGHNYHENRLQDAVDDGELTAQQKTQNEQKLKELQDAREQTHEQLKQWAEDNNISLRDVMPLRSGHHRGQSHNR